MSSKAFNTGEPIAYFITWTTYGTWLPGDERGWNQKGNFDSLPPDPLAKVAAEGRMKEQPFLLGTSDRQIVKDTIGAHCEFRGWQLHAVNVRSNHIHVVETASGYAPKTVAAQFKSWCTRKLRPSYQDRKNFWTEGASCRWINRDNDLTSTVDYTAEAQDQKGVEYEKE